MGPESGLPPEEVDWEAVARFFAGESTDAEAESVSQWLAEHPEEASALATMADVTEKVHGSSRPPIDVGAAWRRAAAQMDLPRDTATVERIPPGSRSAARVHAFPAGRSAWSSPALRAAAAIALLASGALIWRARDDAGADRAVAPEQLFATAPAQRDSVVLADGTGVLLGPGSSLRVDAGYGAGGRTVRLDGEALFDVRHDDARPFVVHTSDLSIHDLGTTFTVRTTNGTAGITRVAVTVGAVRVSRPATPADSGVVLREGEMAAVGAGPIIVQRGTAMADELAWTRGQLVFRDTPLPAVAAALRRWYGVRVEIADERLNARTLTASFEGEPLADVLRVIALALDAPVQQVDSIVMMGTRSSEGRPRS